MAKFTGIMGQLSIDEQFVSNVKSWGTITTPWPNPGPYYDPYTTTQQASYEHKHSTSYGISPIKIISEINQNPRLRCMVEICRVKLETIQWPIYCRYDHSRQVLKDYRHPELAGYVLTAYDLFELTEKLINLKLKGFTIQPCMCKACRVDRESGNPLPPLEPTQPTPAKKSKHKPNKSSARKLVATNDSSSADEKLKSLDEACAAIY